MGETYDTYLGNVTFFLPPPKIVNLQGASISVDQKKHKKEQ